MGKVEQCVEKGGPAPKDALQNSESYQYDGEGNLTQFTDRRGKVTTYGYDGLDRRTFAGFGMQSGPTYESTIGYAYDAVDRVKQAVDSITGTITRTYDDQNRQASEQTPQGTVNYSYDLAGRPQTMAVTGQSAVTYSYDGANRLNQIAQGNTNVSFTYDNDGRRTSLTLPSGVVVNYGYDAVSELSGMAYQAGSTVLGNLAYSYDLAGRRVGMTGSFARTGLPNTVSTAAYNANNQLMQWGPATLAYDANGNMLNDGTNSFVWDARNQLASMNMGGASFQYDPFGRRVAKTVLSSTTNFLYDGVNPAQELAGTTPTANLLTGGLDEYFTRTDSTGTANFLTDALGGTLALADGTGVLQSQYTYEPFGATTLTGPATTNSLAYTGRELDATGLYFYRARYYAPGLGRFISEDPIGFAGGQANLYGYVGNSPSNFIDPLGLDEHGIGCKTSVIFPMVRRALLRGGATDQINNALGNSQFVHNCSGWHTLGTATGIALTTAIGGAAGAEAAEANAGEKGYEFSHWIPNRMGGPRSVFNGNYVSQEFHYLTDPFRYPSGWQNFGPKLNPALQQALRIPWVYDGAAAGAAYGGGGAAMSGRGCGCN